MSEYLPTGFNLVEAVRPLEDRRTRKGARAAASEGAIQRRPRGTTKRVHGRGRRNWWTLLIPE